MDTSKKILWIVSGIIFIAMGIFILANPLESLITLTLYLSIALILSGIFSIIFYFNEGKRILGGGEIILSAILDLLCGILMIKNVGVSTVVLLTFFTVFTLIKGVVIFIFSFDLRAMGMKRWWAVMLIGIIDVLLGAYGIMNISVAGALVVTLMGVGFIILGISYFIILIECEKFTNYLGKHMSM